jgi:hypothetical protein
MMGRVLILTLIPAMFLSGCNSSEPKTLAHPQPDDISWQIEPEGVRVNVRFDNKLEIDTLLVYYAVQLEGQSGGTSYRKQVVSTHLANGFELQLEKGYFPGFSHDSLAALNSALPGQAHVYAVPVGKKIALVKNGNADNTKEHQYFNFMVTHDAGGKQIHDNFRELKAQDYVMEIEE